MRQHDHPLFEFDPERHALINPPLGHGLTRLPSVGVICWFGDVVRKRIAGLAVELRVPFEHGAHDVAVVQHDGCSVVLVNAPVGAPAAVGVLEYLISHGTTKIIGCGGAGIIAPGFDVGHVIVPTGAVRDEGTSYHYVDASTVVGPHPESIEVITSTLRDQGVPFDRGWTWTTDAFFRETPAKIARRRAQGCLTVEMEASAMFAVAAFRGAAYGQLLYAGDDVSAQTWNHRGWDKANSAREGLLDLALSAAVRHERL